MKGFKFQNGIKHHSYCWPHLIYFNRQRCQPILIFDLQLGCWPTCCIYQLVPLVYNNLALIPVKIMINAAEENREEVAVMLMITAVSCIPDWLLKTMYISDIHPKRRRCLCRDGQITEVLGKHLSQVLLVATITQGNEVQSQYFWMWSIELLRLFLDIICGPHVLPPTCQQERVVDIRQWKGKGLTSRLVRQLYSSAWITLCRSVVQWVAVSFSAAYAHHVSRPTQQNTNYYHNQEI